MIETKYSRLKYAMIGCTLIVASSSVDGAKATKKETHLRGRTLESTEDAVIDYYLGGDGGGGGPTATPPSGGYYFGPTPTSPSGDVIPFMDTDT